LASTSNSSGPGGITYTYLLASRHGGEALIVDPVLERVDRYLQLVRELDLKLVKAVDTHLHADHVTGLGALRDRTHCITVMGEHTRADVVSMRVAEGDRIEIEGVRLDVLYTAGHVRGRAVDIAIEKSRMVRHHQEVGMTAECAARVAHQLSQYLR
jgi:glyoxylase-like metal-dependent hydrolase (beta-lactamase superfamily II)